MKSKKRIMSLILASAMLVPAAGMVGCKSKSFNVVGTVKPGELVVSTYGFSYGTDWLIEILDKFVETKDGVSYRLVEDNNVVTNMQSAMQANKNLADIYIPTSAASWVSLVQGGYLADLTSVYEAEVDTSKGKRKVKDFMDDEVVEYYYMQQYLGQGEYYPWILPLGSVTMSFVYNENILLSTQHTTAKAGQWSVGETWTAPPETMEDMVAYCADLNAKGVVPFSWPGLAMHWFSYFMTTWFAQYQGYTTENLQNVGPNDGCYADFANFTSAENWKMKGLQVAYDAFRSLVVDTNSGAWKNSLPGVTSYSEQQAAEHFVNGEAAMCFGGSFMYRENMDLMDQNFDGQEDFTMKMMAIPTVAGAEKNADGTTKKYSYKNVGEYLCVPTQAVNLDLAKEFLAFMCSEENNHIFTNATSTMRPFEYDPFEGQTKEWAPFEYTTLKLYNESEKISQEPLGVARDKISPIARFKGVSIMGTKSVFDFYSANGLTLTAEEVFVTGKGAYKSVYDETVDDFLDWCDQYDIS